MGNSKITVIGMYNWDHSLFDNLVLPSALSSDDVVMSVLMEAGEFETLFSDFDFFKTAIGIWSRKNIGVWNELWETTQYEYNPIHNYDRTETRTNTQTRNLASTDNETRNLSWQDRETRNLTDSNTETRDLGSESHETGTIGVSSSSDTDTTSNSTVTGSGKAYNDADLVTKDRTVTSATGSEDNTSSSTETRNLTQTGSDTGTITNSGTHGGTDTHDGTDTGTVNRTGSDTGTVGFSESVSISGNIGVMSTQNMIQQQRDIVTFNLIDYIVNDFKHSFCVMKY